MNMELHDETIAVRAYTIPRITKNNTNGGYFEAKFGKTSFDRILVFDTETTVDHYQNLKFGYFEIYQYNKLEYCGLFYDRVILKENEISVLQIVAKESNITLYTADEFRKIFCHEAYDLQTLCVGFNLPFDLTRIAISAPTARGKNGFSLKLSNNLDYPRLHIVHHSSTLSFVNWANPRIRSSGFRGHFVDLRTLAFALTNKKHSLESACREFKTEYQKSKAEHGRVDSDYIKYCINDVKASFSLYQKMKVEFDSYQLGMSVTKAYTPASIGKHILQNIGVRSFFDKNKDFEADVIGNVMSSYYGARVDNMIRKTPTLVDLLDFVSMYPTVCILQDLWRFVIAKKIVHKDATQEISELVENIRLEDIQDKKSWKNLAAIVLVEADEDVLPIRAKFGQKHAWNTGLCYVSSREPLWYCLSDIISSKLLTGKTPRIIKAVRFIPVGVQKGLKEIEVHGVKINPYRQDLFKELVEYRQVLKQKGDRKEKIIKIIANAISYGIFLEINTYDQRKAVPVDVYGLTHFRQDKKKIEKTGVMFNPIIASAITSASRLLLAAAEAILARHDSAIAYCDTDSMMVSPNYTKMLQQFFSKLNPYSFDSDILKIERQSVGFYGISAKRYCLYTIQNGELVIDDEKYSAHGLGHLLDPFKTKLDEESSWQKQVWKDILLLHYEKISGEWMVQKYENKYAVQQLVISKPSILSRFREINREKDYAHQIKAANFAILGFSNIVNEDTGDPIKPFAPFQNPAKNAVYCEFVDYNQKNGKKMCGRQYWKSIWDWIREYLIHAEGKFDGIKGVLRRKHVRVSRIIHVGKESSNLEESEIFGLDDDSYQTYEDLAGLDEALRKRGDELLNLTTKDVRKFGISRQTWHNVKARIESNQINHISRKIKIQLFGVTRIL